MIDLFVKCTNYCNSRLEALVKVAGIFAIGCETLLWNRAPSVATLWRGRGRSMSSSERLSAEMTDDDDEVCR